MSPAMAPARSQESLLDAAACVRCPAQGLPPSPDGEPAPGATRAKRRRRRSRHRKTFSQRLQLSPSPPFDNAGAIGDSQRCKPARITHQFTVAAVHGLLADADAPAAYVAPSFFLATPRWQAYISRAGSTSQHRVRRRLADVIWCVDDTRKMTTIHARRTLQGSPAL